MSATATDQKRKQAQTTKQREQKACPWYHYSNWLWTVMVGVIVAGVWYPLLGLAVLVCFLGAIVSGPIAGRWWCGNVCPRGNFWDRIMSKAIRAPKMPNWAKSKVVRVVVLLALMAAMITQTVAAWGDWSAVGGVFWRLLTITTAVGILMALTGHHRAWCKVCPAGTMANWFSKGKGPQLKIDATGCKQCTACLKACPMDLEPRNMAREGGPTDPDCLKCRQCVNSCPVDVLSLKSKDQEDEAA